jgi:hypothetical protein
MWLNGIVLISSILNFETTDFAVGNDLPYVTFLPSYTTTAWYYKKLAPELQADFAKTVAESERFALNEYALALMQGAKLSDSERQKIVTQLARYTGLSPKFVEQNDLRIPPGDWRKSSCGPAPHRRRPDGRLLGTTAMPPGRGSSRPSYAAIYGPSPRC